MDEAKLQEIEARANAATPGPWRSGGFYGLGRVQDGDHAGWVLGGAFPIGRCAFCARAPEPCSATVMHRGEYDAAPRAYHAHWIAAEPGEGWQGISSDAVALAITGNYDYARGGVRSTPEDSAFIAHARTDVPALVAEVRRLTAQFSNYDMDHALRDAAEQAELLQHGAERARDAARADLARLRAEHAAALDAARREGAEGMRERCADAITARLVEAVREVREKTYRGTGAEKDIATAVWEAIDAMRDTVRALPLDAPGGAS